MDHNRLEWLLEALVKNLLLNWTLGEQYFQETLLDYDEASNAAGWQWIAGCGADASLIFEYSIRFCSQSVSILKQIYFAIFTPITNIAKNLLNFQPHLQEQAFQSLVNQNLYYKPLLI